MFVSDALVEHYKYLTDEVRLSAYQSLSTSRSDLAMLFQTSVLVPAFLGLFACRAGAAHVYSIGVGSIILLAREICRVIGFLDRVTYLRGLSTELELTRKVDVIVADQIAILARTLVWYDSSRMLENALETWRQAYSIVR